MDGGDDPDDDAQGTGGAQAGDGSSGGRTKTDEKSARKRASGSGTADGKQAPHSARKEKPLPPAAKRKKAAEARAKGALSHNDPAEAPGGGRYTAPIPASKRGPSPRWVPVLMFALWGVGLAMILLNYMGLLPGSDDGGNGWYLVGGLGLILGGIITATQYR